MFFKETYGIHVNEKGLSFLIKCLVWNEVHYTAYQ